MRNPVVLVSLLLLLSCGGNEDPVETGDGVEEVAATWTVDLATEDLPLVVELGDRNSLGADTALVNWNEEFGRVEVTAGPRFSIMIMEAPGDLDRLKADLERDMLQTHTILEEDASGITYRSQFPDEDLVFIHFRKVLEVGGRTFIVEDGAEGRFNEADIKRMAGAVQPKTATGV